MGGKGGRQLADFVIVVLLRVLVVLLQENNLNKSLRFKFS